MARATSPVPISLVTREVRSKVKVSWRLPCTGCTVNEVTLAAALGLVGHTVISSQIQIGSGSTSFSRSMKPSMPTYAHRRSQMVASIWLGSSEHSSLHEPMTPAFMMMLMRSLMAELMNEMHSGQMSRSGLILVFSTWLMVREAAWAYDATMSTRNSTPAKVFIVERGGTNVGVPM